MQKIKNNIYMYWSNSIQTDILKTKTGIGPIFNRFC